MTVKEFFSFKKNRFFWLNILGMIAVVFLLIFIVLQALESYTRKGEGVVVPNAKGLTIGEAEILFNNDGLSCIISDSTYVKDKPAGSVLDHTPPGGQKVKKGRIIYLTINTRNVPLQSVPDVADNSSLRQAQAKIQSAGFKLAEVETINGEKDWVYGVKYKGKQLQAGDKVPMGATLTLVVGRGGGGDDGENEENGDNGSDKSSGTDESWF